MLTEPSHLERGIARARYAFPEEMFAPAPQRKRAYEEHVQAGRDRMRQTSCVIAGLARNVEKCLRRTVAGIEALGEMFGDYRVVLFENDSTDRTVEMLGAWGRENPRVEVITEVRGDPVNPPERCLKRATRMAVYRNAYLERIRAAWSHLAHVIVLDTDLKVGWSLDGVAHTFGHDGWDFVGSNGIIFRRSGRRLNKPMQYDAWAFRWDEGFTALTTQEVNELTWQRGEGLVKVTCSFGGLGVYRMEAFLAGAYSGDDVDHVTHQMKARAAGFRRVFLNPSQITVYGRHWRRSDRWMMPLMRCLSRERPIE